MPSWGLKSKILIINALILAITVLSVLIVFVIKHQDLANELTRGRGIAATQQLAALSQYAAHDQPLLQTLAITALEEKGVRSVQIHIGDTVVNAGPRMQESQQTHSYAPLEKVTIYTDKNSSRFVRNIPSNPAGQVSIEYANHFLYAQHYQLMFSASLFAAILMSLVIGLVPTLTSGYSSKLRRINNAIKDATDSDGISRIEPLNNNDELSHLATKLNSMWQYSADRELSYRRNADQTARDYRETLETLEIQNIELDIARKEAVKVSQLKSEFLANTSHEIRTPLNGIIGFSNLVTKTELNPKQKELVQTIHESAHGLLRIINDILDFSKIEAGKLTLEYMSFNLYDLMEECLALMAPTIHEKIIDLNLIYDSNVPEYIQGDPARLKQVITNLVHNAIKFTGAGHVTARVKYISAQEAEISISDTGIGLSLEQQESLFEAFTQADQTTSRQYGGTGLGLAIAQRLIKQMGSHILVDSQQGQGATFKFTLSLTEEEQNNTPSYPQSLQQRQIHFFDPEDVLDFSFTQLFSRWACDNIRYDTLENLCTTLSSEKQKTHTVIIVLRYSIQNSDAINLISQLSQQHQTLLIQPTYKIDVPPIKNTEVLSAPFRRAALLNCILNREAEKRPAAVEHKKAASTSTARLLIVDDNEPNLKLLGLLLEQMDYQFLSASSGEQALLHCEQESFDLIMMDIQMPGLSGIETTLRLRQQSSLNRATPIIAVTAHAQSEEKQSFINAGMNDYLGKPIIEEDLQELLQKWSNTQRSEMQEKGPRIAPVAIDLCLKRVGQKPDIARDMLIGLVDSLADFEQKISRAHTRNDNEALLEAVHKLHGVCCYSGTPALQASCYQLETAIKSTELDSISELTTVLLENITEVQQWAQEHDIDILFEC